MKNYIEEIVIGALQLLLFYVFPLFAGPTDTIGMVFLIIVGTFMLSLLIGSLSSNKVKYFYSVFTALIFIPTIFIYYNETALVHSIWYLVIASVGLLIGSLMHKLVNRE